MLRKKVLIDCHKYIIIFVFFSVLNNDIQKSSSSKNQPLSLTKQKEQKANRSKKTKIGK